MGDATVDKRDVYWRLTERPALVVVVSLAFIIWTAFGLTTLSKDTSVRAFIPQDHSSVITDQAIKDIFGVGDTIAVAVEFTDGASVFAESSLRTIDAITSQLRGIDNVNTDRLASLATESAIIATADGIDVVRYRSAGGPEQGRKLWSGMPPHQGTLVSFDERSALVILELNDIELAADTYADVQQLLSSLDLDGVVLRVAGPAAVSAFLSQKIDQDARVLQPVVFLVVLLVIYLAFRRIDALFGVLIVIVGATVGAMGTMAWQGVPYFAITNALPVILVSIAVADSIHVLSHYYHLRSVDKNLGVREAVVASMQIMARPIFYTSVTTAAGFAGIGMASIMPPITYFAWYAAAGVGLAWAFSMVTLPSVIILLRLKPSPAFAKRNTGGTAALNAGLLWISRLGVRRPAVAAITITALTLIAISQALTVRFDRSQVENFALDEPIRQADAFINSEFVGTSFLDVMIEAEPGHDLLSAETMQRIVDLQKFMESQQHVTLTVSIADYVALLHAAFEQQPPTLRELPRSDDAIAQYLFVYEASGDPGDLDEEIDASRSRALVRGTLSTVHFTQTRETVEAIQAYIDEQFATQEAAGGLKVTLGGDVNTTYHWMSRLESSHFLGVTLSLSLVLLAAIAVFRLAAVGLLAVVPVSLTVLLLYAGISVFDLYLEPATSMFAAIAVGLGVDFAIHLIESLRLARREGASLDDALAIAIPSTGRACFFNIVALGGGFSVLLASGLPMLQRFGALVALAAFLSFLVSLVVVPTGFALLEYWRGRTGKRFSSVTAGGAVLITALTPVVVDEARAERADWVVNKVWTRAESPASTRRVEMVLTDRRDNVKRRQAVVLKISDPDQNRMSRVTFTSPRAIRRTTFLSDDRRDQAENRWLYLPATKRVRRIPSSDRGDAFFGTDFSYDDVQSELKFDPVEYDIELADRTDERDNDLVLLGVPKTPAMSEELGFSRFVAVIDDESWLPRQIQFFDEHDEPLKRIDVREQQYIDGIWTATEIFAEHQQNHHSTLFVYHDTVHLESLDPAYFDPRFLDRDLPANLVDVP